MHFLTVGTSAVLVEARDLDRSMRIFNAVTKAHTDEAGPCAAITQIVPAARTVLIRFNPMRTVRSELIAAIRGLDTDIRLDRVSRRVRIPVVYDGDDLEDVAGMLGISTDELIARHTTHPWKTAFVGFAPGFAYLTDGDPIFDVPRRGSPRLNVPAGAVGLAGTFSGIYPRASSGGWQLIGTTAQTMWDVHRNPPATVQPGDRVEFYAVREHAEIVQDSPDPQYERSGAEPDQHATRRPNTTSATNPNNPTSAPALLVNRPGMFSVFEDNGRNAANLGVTGSGCCDMEASHLANDLLGNPAGEPVVEIAAGNAEFTALRDVVLAVAGAPVSITIRGKGTSSTAINRQEAFLLNRGERVAIGEPTSGFRDYLAMQGGFQLQRELGSASRDTMAGIGPAPLQAKDILYAADHGHGTVSQPQQWRELPKPGDTVELEVTLGPRDDWFTDQAVADLFGEAWVVTPQSNRVGLRLQGDRPLERRTTDELASEGTVPGAVEVPNNGQPVLFLRDQPVTGGYPVIAVLTPESLDLAAQLPPGVRITCKPVHSDGDRQEEWT